MYVCMYICLGMSLYIDIPGVPWQFIWGHAGEEWRRERHVYSVIYSAASAVTPSTLRAPPPPGFCGRHAAQRSRRWEVTPLKGHAAQRSRRAGTDPAYMNKCKRKFRADKFDNRKQTKGLTHVTRNFRLFFIVRYMSQNFCFLFCLSNSSVLIFRFICSCKRGHCRGGSLSHYGPGDEKEWYDVSDATPAAGGGSWLQGIRIQENKFSRV